MSHELYNLFYAINGDKIEFYEMKSYEKEYLKNLSKKRDDKSLKRIAEIKSRIVNDLNKNTFDKKYQIQTIHEYNLIKDFFETLDGKGHELLWYHGDLKRNQLCKIIQGNYRCCRDCDTPIKFITRQVDVKYCYFYLNN